MTFLEALVSSVHYNTIRPLLGDQHRKIITQGQLHSLIASAKAKPIRLRVVGDASDAEGCRAVICVRHAVKDLIGLEP